MGKHPEFVSWTSNNHQTVWFSAFKRDPGTIATLGIGKMLLKCQNSCSLVQKQPFMFPLAQHLGGKLCNRLALQRFVLDLGGWLYPQSQQALLQHPLCLAWLLLFCAFPTLSTRLLATVTMRSAHHGPHMTERWRNRSSCFALLWLPLPFSLLESCCLPWSQMASTACLLCCPPSDLGPFQGQEDSMLFFPSVYSCFPNSSWHNTVQLLAGFVTLPCTFPMSRFTPRCGWGAGYTRELQSHLCTEKHRTDLRVVGFNLQDPLIHPLFTPTASRPTYHFHKAGAELGLGCSAGDGEF